MTEKVEKGRDEEWISCERGEGGEEREGEGGKWKESELGSSWKELRSLSYSLLFSSKMPFMGRDWRGPGEKWVKTPFTNGWERTKLRPIQVTIFTLFIPLFYIYITSMSMFEANPDSNFNTLHIDFSILHHLLFRGKGGEKGPHVREKLANSIPFRERK